MVRRVFGSEHPEILTRAYAATGDDPVASGLSPALAAVVEGLLTRCAAAQARVCNTAMTALLHVACGSARGEQVTVPQLLALGGTEEESGVAGVRRQGSSRPKGRKGHVCWRPIAARLLVLGP